MSATRQALFWVSALAIFFLLLHLLSGMLLPFVLGLGIAYILAPLVVMLRRWNLPRGLAALTALLLFLFTLVTIIVLIVPVIELQAAQLARSAPAAVDFVRREIQVLLDLAQQKLAPEDLAKVHDMVGGWTGSALTWAAGLAQRLLSSGLALANTLSLLLITPLVAFFMLRDWDMIVARLDALLPRQYAPVIREQLSLVNETMAGYLHGQGLVSLIVGIYYAVALSVTGLDFAFILGVVVGILSFIPYIGEAFGLILALSLAAMQFGSWTKIGIIAAIFVVGHLVGNDVLQPKLVGSRVHLHPIWVIFALLAFGALFGFVGVLLALPAAAVTGVLVRFALARYLASPLYDPARGKHDHAS
jgi:predicted PurR-regulated permease PerM